MGGLRSLRPSPYLVYGTLFWVLVTAAAWRIPVCCDFGQHAAVVERLKASLTDPAHPMAAAPGDGSPYYSPYAVLQGLFAQVSGLAGWQVVKLSGPVNLLVLLTGLNRFVKALTPNRWAPLLALACMVLLWGTQMAWWSGYLGLMSLAGHLPFPSTLAIGLTFWAWSWTARLTRDGGRTVSYAGLGALGGLILLIHPISSVGAMIGVVAFVPGWGVRGGTRTVAGPRLRPVAGWAVASVAAVVVVLSWPYYSLFDLLGDGSIDGMHRALYDAMPERFWLAFLGLPALVARWRRDRRDPLVLMFALGALTIAYGWISGHYTYGRIMGLTLIPLQFALAIELTGPRPWTWGRRALAALCGAGLVLGFLTVQAGAVLPRAWDPVGFDQPPRWPSYAWAARHIAPGEVVLTNGYRATRSLPGFGPNLVAPAWPDPAMRETERARRSGAVRRYLDPASSVAERAQVVREFHVRWLLLDPGRRVPREAVVVAWGPRTGEVLARVG
ncbi:hypothetical protein ACIBI4_20390 [Streptomyces sp. NPDC050418]|uniref:hypothetical protein n=1 Tax=Streptomyces sp. NPDC050418 TaxID=3365612 RepID=UPI00378FF9C1